MFPLAQRIIHKALLRVPYLWRFSHKFAPKFAGSNSYWDDRYSSGGTSGPGSYGQLAEFKADVINSFVKEKHVGSVIEFGCGDGAQLQLANYPKYIGFDVSKSAVRLCVTKYGCDSSKSFFLYDQACFCDNEGIFQADLTLSLDVLYHLVEDDVFEQYLKNLFAASAKYVIIYSSNYDEVIPNSHVRHRRFSDYVDSNFSGWFLIAKIDQKYTQDRHGADSGSFAEFYIYEKRS